MAQHKFKVGQFVDYKPGRLSGALSASRYKILRLLPAEGSDLLYRIKSVDETFERVAKEHELSQRGDWTLRAIEPAFHDALRRAVSSRTLAQVPIIGEEDEP